MTFFVMAESPSGRELHIVDPSESFFQLLEIHTGVFNEGSSREIPKDGVENPGDGAFAGDIFVFAASATDFERYELYVSDGTESGTRFLTALTPDDPGRSDPQNFESFGDLALFSAYTETYGRELWLTDGTVAGTRLLADITEGESSGVRDTYRFIDINGVAWSKEAGGLQYFWLEDVEAGAALWRTDGTTEGTFELMGSTPDWLSASDSARRFLGIDVGRNMGATIALDDQLIFGAASRDQQNALWITNGTSVSLLTDFGGNDGTEIPSDLIEVDGQVYFITNDSNGNSRTEIWRTDGTPDGTQIFTELSGEGSRPSHLTRFGDHLYFRGNNSDGGGDVGFELYRAGLSDGVIELFADTEPGSGGGSIRDLTAIGDRLYFSVNDRDLREPWVTDGTAEGTFQLANISASGGSADANDGGYGFFESDGVVFFVARSDAEGHELWATDGTQSGTFLAVPFVPGRDGSSPVTFVRSTPEALNVSGTAGADDLEGQSGDDTLRGLDGDDRLLGNDGNDSLDGGLGTDTLNGGAGDDTIIGGPGEGDLRDQIFGGAGNDSIDAGAGNDLIFGQGGNDTIAGGFGVDELQGQDGDDVITGSAFSDLVFGGAGNDFVNGGFGSDRINGGSGADKFFHVGVLGHGSDWVQDYVAADGDVLLWGGASATASDFQVNLAHTTNDAGERSGDDAVREAFVIYRPTEQILWALVDGEGQSSINLQIGGDTFDLLA